jgi:hypothetical protein
MPDPKLLEIESIERVDLATARADELREDPLSAAKKTITMLVGKLQEAAAGQQQAREDRTVALAEDLLRVLVNQNASFPGKPGEAARECARQAAILHAECARIAANGLGEAGSPASEKAGGSADDADEPNAVYRPDADAEIWGLD